jgi:lipopolysaccharide/colanic/teichoic acid biosynthesis glycosyltransferase
VLTVRASAAASALVTKDRDDSPRFPTPCKRGGGRLRAAWTALLACDVAALVIAALVAGPRAAMFGALACVLVVVGRAAFRRATVRRERVLLLRDQFETDAFLHGDAPIDHIVVAAGALDDDAFLRLGIATAARSVRLSLLMPGGDAFERLGAVERVAGMPVLRLHDGGPGHPATTAKRVLDVVVATLALLLFAPLVLLIVIAIRLDSRGPAFFRQARVGRSGRPFVMWKFRTMVVDAEQRVAELLPLSRDPHWLDLESDPRVTRVGRLLRAWSLDELPQLWNVLRGDMSLVGPRPLIPADHARLPAWARPRDDVRPGLTGLWQVSGRASVPFEQMVRLDGRYVIGRSLRCDAEMLLRTIPALLSRRGAN